MFDWLINSSLMIESMFKKGSCLYRSSLYQGSRSFDESGSKSISNATGGIELYRIILLFKVSDMHVMRLTFTSSQPLTFFNVFDF